MKPEASSQKLLSITRSKAKMFEYDVPIEKHIKILKDPARLFPLSIALLGDLAAEIASSNGNEISSESEKQLRFAAHFFDSYQGTNLNPEIENYLRLICAATYYLCDLPGSASVIIRRVNIDFDNHGLENLLTWLLSGKFEARISVADSIFTENINQILDILPKFYSGAVSFDSLAETARIIKKKAYLAGTNRDLLIADLIGAVLKKRHSNSCWNSLPAYSNLPVGDWAPYLTKRNALCELWPAQHLIGKEGLLQGVSAIVQMPTSAGKTRATELIIRSAFLSGRASVAVVIAPFKALCHEIRDGYSRTFGNEDVLINELTDVLQFDFNLDDLSEIRRKQVIIATPEKFLYVLKHVPDLARVINLLIYDEGHQFDNGLRGITYELLLTSLKGLIPENAQTILISAVISNANQIGDWLSRDRCKVLTGFDLSPTYRTVAFSSWLDRRGRLEFVSPIDPDAEEFFVPQIIEAIELNRFGRERRTINFPTKDDPQSIALYLGIKLVTKGGIAIFCGTKKSVTKICEKLVEAYERGLSLPLPIHCSDAAEVERLTYLCDCHLGENSSTTKAASCGVFAHHGNIPTGIRLSIEYAMKESLVKFVICTSTLTQGVNLPIRYLILANLYQGDEQIKVRDFHNLLGRVGRSGMHTEGSIIFADPSFYDCKNGNSRARWRWGQVKSLLTASNSEPCASMLLSIFYPLRSDDKKYTIALEPMELVSLFINEPEKLYDLANDIAEEHSENGFTVKGLMFQVRQKMDALAAIESYLMSQSSENEQGITDGDLMLLAEGTLAYHLADDGMKTNLKELFRLLGVSLRQRIPDVARRRVFSRSMYGIKTSLDIERWISENAAQVEECANHKDLLDTLWPLLSIQIHNTSFIGCSDANILKDMAIGWIDEQPFYQVFDLLIERNITFGLGSRRLKAKLDHVMDICEIAFGYEMSLAIGAVAETYSMLKPEMTDALEMLLQLQKRMKYGVASNEAIMLYELGFADRVIAIDLRQLVVNAMSKGEMVQMLRRKTTALQDILHKYPAYFQNKMRLLGLI